MRTLLHPRIPFGPDVVLLVSRVLVGVVLLVHGLQKLNTFTPAGTEMFLDGAGVPLAGIAAWWLIITEIGGGILLIAGALTPLGALVSVANMLGAIVFVPVPDKESADIREVAAIASYGWGVIPVSARVGDVAFETSLFPKDGGYLLPLKDAVRRPGGLGAGDEVAVAMTVRLTT